MVLHIDGTTMPNTPPEPQYLRATAYLPPAFVANHTTSHAAIARIAQMFIESVGVPTVQDWFNNARHLGWSLTQPGPGAAPNTWSPELIPPNHPGTSHYRFFGQPVGALDTLLGSPHTPAPAPAPASVPVPVVVIGDDKDDFEDMTMGLMDAIERANSAEAESADRLERIHQLEQQVDILIARVAAANTLADDLGGQLLTARHALSARDGAFRSSRSLIHLTFILQLHCLLHPVVLDLALQWFAHQRHRPVGPHLTPPLLHTTGLLSFRLH